MHHDLKENSGSWRPYPDDGLKQVITDWRPKERICFRRQHWGIYYRGFAAACLAGVILAVPATRAWDLVGAAALFAVGWVIAFPIALFVLQALRPPGQVVLDLRRMELTASGPRAARSLKDVSAIVFQESETATGLLRVGILAVLQGDHVRLLDVEDIASAGGFLAPNEAATVRTISRKLADAIGVPWRTEPYRREHRSLIQRVRNTTWPVRTAAAGSVCLLLYGFRTVPAVPILTVAALTGCYLSRIAHWRHAKWVGALCLVGGFLMFLLTVALNADQVESPWDTPPAPRWIGAILGFFGGGLASGPKTTGHDKAQNVS